MDRSIRQGQKSLNARQMTTPLLLSVSSLSACVFDKWTPTFGDDEITAWLTVAGYGLCAILAILIVSRKPRGAHHGLWILILVFMVLLGINKQLDLQNAITAIGRCAAQAQGWYGDRRVAQVIFILTFATASIIALIMIAFEMASSMRLNGLALIGLGFLFSYAVVRAAGFHHLDQFLTTKINGVERDYLLENGGLLLIALNAAFLLRQSSGSLSDA